MDPLSRTRPGLPQGKKLLDQMRDVMRLKHYSCAPSDPIATGLSALSAITGCGTRMTCARRRSTEFLTHLAHVGQNVAASTQNQALSAFLFLYKEVPERRDRLAR